MIHLEISLEADFIQTLLLGVKYSFVQILHRISGSFRYFCVVQWR